MDRRKCFVGGLARETTIDSLAEHFKKFGLVKDVIIPKSPDDGHPRGFAFVTMNEVVEADSARNALPTLHIVDGKQVDVKPCLDRREQDFSLRNQMHPSTGGKQAPWGDLDPKKIFIGGLPAETTDEGIREIFSEYGTVHHVAIMFDNISRRPKGFGFVTFDSAAVCDSLVAKQYVDYLGKQIEIKRAIMSGIHNSGGRGGLSQNGRGFRYNNQGSGQRNNGYHAGRNPDSGDDCRQDVSYRENLEFRRQQSNKGQPPGQSQWNPAYNQYPVQSAPVEYLPEHYHPAAYGAYTAFDVVSAIPYAYPYGPYPGLPLESHKPAVLPAESEYPGQMRALGGYLPAPQAGSLIPPLNTVGHSLNGHLIMGSNSFPSRNNGAPEVSNGAYYSRSPHGSPRGPYSNPVPNHAHYQEHNRISHPQQVLANPANSGSGLAGSGAGDSVSGAGGSYKESAPFGHA